MLEDSSEKAPKSDADTKLTRAELHPFSKPSGWRCLSPILIQRTNEGVSVQIAWKQAILALILASLSCWFGLASAAYLFVKHRRNFPDVQFRHMLLYPSEKENYRIARGDYLIDQAKEQLKAHDYRDAFQNLRMGSGLSPSNRDGRMLLAQFYVVWQRPDLAQKTLIDGLELNIGDDEYLQALFSFLLQRQEDFELIKLTNDLIARAGPTPVPNQRLQLIAMARASAQFFRGNYDMAEDTLREFRLTDSMDGKLLAVRIEWERGERELAFSRLQTLSDESPENEQVYSQYAAFLREADRTDDLRRLALLRQLSYPDQPRARIDLLYIYDKAQIESSVLTGIEDIFRDFANNGEVMVALADFAANTGRPALARRIYDHCKATNLPWEGAALMTVEAYVVAKQYRESLEASKEMQKDNPEWGKRFASVFNGLQAIANYGLADAEAAQLYLENFLNQSGVRADNLVAVSNRLVSVGAKDQARQVLARAVRSDPLNQTALTCLIRLDLEAEQADSMTTHLRTLLKMRKPPLDLLREAYVKLASDRFLFTPGRTSVLNDLRKILDSSPGRGPTG